MKDLQAASANLVRRLDIEYEELKEESRQLTVQIAQAQEEFTALKKNADKYKQLQSEVNIAERLYSELATKRSENEVNSRYTLMTARPWESAEEAMAPYSPNWRKNVISGLLLSLALATLSAFVLELLDDTVKTARALEKKLGVATLGMVPESPTSVSDTDGYAMVQRQARSPIADHFRNIHIALEVTHGIQSQGKAFIVTITSAGPNEGKSFVSANLATLFASLGRRVLLVDADFRKCSLSRAFNCRPKTGLMEIIAQGRWRKEAALFNESHGYHFLPAPSDQEELGSFDPQAFSTALDQMKKDFDVIVFDTPPVLAMADACAMARVSDVTILVARSRKTRMRELERAAAAVYGANAKEVTFVVNFVDPADASAESYGYGGYGYGYGYGSSSKPTRGGASDASRFKNRKTETEDRGAAS
ncbi:MAG TPA: AAA family ATPase, partial [Planctomycetota bacterium]|nr:AAA family ATPase [Planctomycetota bacterium]